MARKKKRTRLRLGRLFLFICFIVGLIFLIRPIFSIGYHSLDVTKPKMTTYKKVIKGQGYVLLNQDHFYAKNDGIVVYTAREGEKVPVGQEIVTVNFQEDYSKHRDRLIKIQAAIDYKTNKRKTNQEDYQETPELKSIIEDIQNSIKTDAYQDLVGQIHKLDLLTPHNVNVSDLSDLLDKSLEELEAEKDRLSKDLSQTRSRYVSTFPGVVSYTFPSGPSLSVQKGLDRFTLDYLDHLDFNLRKQEGVHIKKGQPVFRMIDNLQWYVGLSVHQDPMLKDLSLGDGVSLSLNGGQSIKGKVYQMNLDSEDKGVVILAMEEGFEDYYQMAKGSGEMILKQEDAYSLPVKTLVDQDGQMGVYVQDLHNLVRFVPVKLIAQNSKWAYIAKGDMKNTIELGKRKVQTVTYEDDVVLDPANVDEKQLLD